MAVVILALLSSLGLSFLAPLAGVLAWVAALMLFHRLSGIQALQVAVLLGVGGAGLIWGALAGGDWQWWVRALEANQALLALLLAVSFLRLVASADLVVDEKLPKGRKALWRTLLGVHLFGAVINFSSLVIMADRMARNKPLQPLQALVLTRGFMLAAHWSPFFAAMGVALINAPGASLWVLILVGLPVALIALFIAGVRLLSQPEAKELEGYPMHLDALLLPVLLAVSVMVLHFIWEDLPVLTLVSGLSLIFSLVLLRKRHGKAARKRLKQHIEHTLPTMSGETLLFLSAGVLAAGLGAMVQAAEFQLSLNGFGPWHAWGLLVVMVFVSAIGVHPVISIATAGGLVAPWVSDPNMLAMVFLMGWALGVGVSPLSGTHLTMQGRYGISAFKFPRWNLGFVLVMLLVDLLVLQLYGFVA